ncbi:hypothetical protein F4779DRAFT_612973 [Xylariaceae sp. FL0662B]|nr:hypothetical protein F4779DRAFT_612973 [Xylariaceae sp. FL0662B]
MEILRKFSDLSFNIKPDVRTPGGGIRVLSATASESPDLTLESREVDTPSFIQDIRNSRLFNENAGDTYPSLNVVFFPEKVWKDVQKKDMSVPIFDYLCLDHAIHSYLISSRSGWYSVENEDGFYSFMIKDYMYMLAWSFNPRTMVTRAMLAERSDYKIRSCLKTPAGVFDLPGLRREHLYHPLSLACIGLADYVFYFDLLIVDESINIGTIENSTGHGLWVKKQENKLPQELPHLLEASRNIARIIGILANLFKSVEVAQSIAISLEETHTWKGLLEKHSRDPAGIHNKCASSFRPAAKLLQRRIRTIKQSGRVLDERAKAQLSVVSALIRREDTLVSHLIAASNAQLAVETKKDSADMKVIAMMTMAFLPATFFAALFAVPSLKWEGPGDVITEKFWVYWAFTVPTTILVFVTWDVFNDQKMLTKLWAMCGIKLGEKQQQPDVERPPIMLPNLDSRTFQTLSTFYRK